MNPDTGKYKLVEGSWDGYTGVRINKLIYLFGNSLFRFDLDSFTYAKINNDYWTSGVRGTTDGKRLFVFYKNDFYLIEDDKFHKVILKNNYIENTTLFCFMPVL